MTATTIATTHEPWTSRAACADAPKDLFFPPEGGFSVTLYAQAKAICACCPVAEDCLTYALTNDITHGIWGGTLKGTRRRLSALHGPYRTIARNHLTRHP